MHSMPLARKARNIATQSFYVAWADTLILVDKINSNAGIYITRMNNTTTLILQSQFNVEGHNNEEILNNC